MVEGGRPWKRALRLALLGWLATVCLLVVILSPVAFSALDRLGRRDWERLSAIGQTYGAVSALLAAVALGGVVVSIVQQRRAADIDREHAYRAVHMELMWMMLEHPELTEVFGAAGTQPLREDLQWHYCNQRIRALEMGFEIGVLNETYIEGSAWELFTSPITWKWWQSARDAKRSVARKRQGQMFDILDDVWRRLGPEIERLDPSWPSNRRHDGKGHLPDDGPAIPDAANPRRSARRRRRVLVATGISLGGIAVLAVTNSTRRRIVRAEGQSSARPG